MVRDRLLAALAGVALALGACGGEPEVIEVAVPELPRPHHVLIVLVDTLRADHMAVYGYPRDTTPFLDAFLEQGVRFDRAASQSSWTAPSVISMFTGRDVAGESLAMPADLPAMAELFQQAGYRTGASSSRSSTPSGWTRTSRPAASSWSTACGGSPRRRGASTTCGAAAPWWRPASTRPPTGTRWSRACTSRS